MRIDRLRVISAAAACIYMILGSTAAVEAQARSSRSNTDWARGGVCYEIFVRSFFDSDGDGVGDLNGLTRKLDYVTRLGANCIWLMPIAQSPSYHGYDVTNYYEVNRDYGTTADFKRFMAEAHRRGIRVLVDLVLNHTSSEHPYFQSALMDSASPYRSWYLWSPVQKKAKGWEAPVWHRNPYRDEYYYGLFWSGMPDLNLLNPQVKAEVQKISRYWLKDMGVDGFRLDAAAHFIEAPDTVMNASGNNPWLRDFEAQVKRISPNAFTVGEVTYDSPETILRYYPDQLDSYFTFPIANLLIDAVRTGSAAKLMPALAYSQKTFPPGRWSPFLRNHDQTRTMTELKGDFARARVAASLLLTLPGFPFIYYGEEIGMTGSKPDPRLRTPMHWKKTRSAGFTTGMAWEPLQPDSLTANVEAQDNDRQSLLNHYRTLIHLRSANPALGSGDFLPLNTGNDAVAAYLRRKGSRNVVVVANLGTSRTGNIQLSSDRNALPAGTYSARSLMGGSGNTTFRVTDTGSISGWIPVPSLDALTVHIIEISKRD
ncbi:MAG TPA: alpha-amylase family glycosyl hydrolase [Gemmatimonadaceae bacterium]|nr:alpha-amylase family glycosyl hydrolase [Gemmatimonadaceae bacterium]